MYSDETQNAWCRVGYIVEQQPSSSCHNTISSPSNHYCPYHSSKCQSNKSTTVVCSTEGQRFALEQCSDSPPYCYRVWDPSLKMFLQLDCESNHCHHGRANTRKMHVPARCCSFKCQTNDICCRRTELQTNDIVHLGGFANPFKVIITQDCCSRPPTRSLVNYQRFPYPMSPSSYSMQPLPLFLPPSLTHHPVVLTADTNDVEHWTPAAFERVDL